MSTPTTTTIPTSALLLRNIGKTSDVKEECAEADNDSVLSSESDSCDLSEHEDSNKPNAVTESVDDVNDDEERKEAIDTDAGADTPDVIKTSAPPPPPERMASILLTAAGITETNMVIDDNNCPSNVTSPDTEPSAKEGGVKQHKMLVVDPHQMMIGRQMDKMQSEVYADLRYKRRTVHNGIVKLSALKWVEDSLRRAMWHYGRLCANYGVFTSVLHLLLLTLAMTGILCNYRTTFTTFVPSIASLSPTVTPRNHHSDRMAVTVFNTTNPRFRSFDTKTRHKYGVILSTRRSRDSVISEEAVAVYLAVQNAVDATTIHHPITNFTYKSSDLCRVNKCRQPFTQIMMSSRAVPLTYPQAFVALDDNADDVKELWLGDVLGGVLSNEDGVIRHARALAMGFDIVDGEENDLMYAYEEEERDMEENPVETEWARRFTVSSLPADRWVRNNLDIDMWTFASFEGAMASVISDVYAHAAYGLAITALLVIVACTACNDRYAARPILALVILLVIMTTAVSAIGILTALSVTFEHYVFVAFPSITGVISLLTLSLMHAWRRYDNVAIHSVDKTMFLFSWHLPSLICICATIGVVYTAAGLLTAVPLLSYVCLFIAVCASVIFVALLTTFAATLALTGRRQSRGRTWWQCCWTTGGKTEEATGKMLQDFSPSHVDQQHRRLCDRQPNIVARRIGSAIASIHWRFIALLLLAIYLIFAVWGCTQTQVSLTQSDLIPSDSASSKYLRTHNQFYKESDNYIELFFDDYVDYMDDDVRRGIRDILSWAQSKEYTHRISSWLSDFEGFNKSTKYLVNRETFVKVVDLIYLADQRFDHFAADLAFDMYKSRIVASRMYITLNARGMHHMFVALDYCMMRNCRHDLITKIESTARQHRLPLTIRTPMIFSVEHDTTLPTTLYTVIALVACLCSVMTLVCFAEPFTSLLVMLTVVSVTCGTLAIGTLWSTPLNMITLCTLLSGVVYTVSSTMLFCHHYVNAGSAHAHHSGARVMYAFQACMMPLLISTVIAVCSTLPMLAIKAPIVVQVIKITFVHLSLSTVHTLLFLPVCLLLVTDYLPRACTSLRSCAEDACCACCDAEEEAESIYFMTTTGRPRVDENTLKHCIRDGYDGMVMRRGMPPTYALPCEPHQFVISEQPTVLYDADVYDQYATVHKDRHSEEDATSYEASTLDRKSVTGRRESIYENPADMATAKRSDASEASGSQPPQYTVTQPGSVRKHIHGGAELTGNWRQYMLDGSIRRGSIAPSTDFMMPPSIVMVPAFGAIPGQRHSYAPAMVPRGMGRAQHMYQGPMPFFEEQ